MTRSLHVVNNIDELQMYKCQALSDKKKEDQAVSYLANNPHDVCGSSRLLTLSMLRDYA